MKNWTLNPAAATFVALPHHPQPPLAPTAKQSFCHLCRCLCHHCQRYHCRHCICCHCCCGCCCCCCCHYLVVVFTHHFPLPCNPPLCCHCHCSCCSCHCPHTCPSPLPSSPLPSLLQLLSLAHHPFHNCYCHSTLTLFVTSHTHCCCHYPHFCSP